MGRQIKIEFVIYTEHQNYLMIKIKKKKKKNTGGEKTTNQHLSPQLKCSPAATAGSPPCRQRRCSRLQNYSKTILLSQSVFNIKNYFEAHLSSLRKLNCFKTTESSMRLSSHNLKLWPGRFHSLIYSGWVGTVFVFKSLRFYL